MARLYQKYNNAWKASAVIYYKSTNKWFAPNIWYKNSGNWEILQGKNDGEIVEDYTNNVIHFIASKDFTLTSGYFWWTHNALKAYVNNSEVDYTSHSVSFKANDEVKIVNIDNNLIFPYLDLSYANCVKEVLEPFPHMSTDSTDDTLEKVNWFENCSTLEKVCPGLFANNCNKMSEFDKTFKYCTSLKEIPANLFANFKNSYASRFSFYETFMQCTSLKSIPETLFDNLDMSKAMLEYTFDGCSGINTAIPEFWNKFTPNFAQGVFSGCTNALNYASLPSGWK